MVKSGDNSLQWNERSAIHYRMNQLQDELKAVRDEYERLFDRLRDLDKADAQQYLHTQSMNFDSHSETKSKPSRNESNTKEDTPSKKIPTFMNTNVINEVLAGLQRGDIKKKEKSLTSTEKIINHQNTEKKKKYSKEEAQKRKEFILSLLKSNDMRAKDISNALIENGFKVNNISYMLNELRKEIPQIQRIDRGIYTWNEENSSSNNESNREIEAQPTNFNKLELPIKDDIINNNDNPNDNNESDDKRE